MSGFCPQSKREMSVGITISAPNFCARKGAPSEVPAGNADRKSEVVLDPRTRAGLAAE
jgi:hypothetical protein